jgi:hypothetical protein
MEALITAAMVCAVIGLGTSVIWLILQMAKKDSE